MTEEWASIKNWEGFYEVSNTGKIRSVDRLVVYSNNKRRVYKGIIKKLSTDKDGYLKVNLYNKDKNECNKVHCFVANAFLPKIDGKDKINHKDGNKKNNNVSNLEWVTHEENMYHASKMGLVKSKISDDDYLFIKNNYIPRHPELGRKALEKRFGISKTHISQIVSGSRTRKHLEEEN